MMRKAVTPAVMEEVPLRKQRVRRAVCLIAIGLALGPLFYEGSAIVAARWRTMLGVPTAARTPVLDALGQGLATASGSVQRTAAGAFRNVPWRPAYVIPAALCWAAGGSFLLRRCGHR